MGTEEREGKKGFGLFFRGCQEEEEKIACGTERNALSNSIMLGFFHRFPFSWK